MAAQKDTFDKIQAIASTASLAIIPIVIAVMGWKIQSTLSEQSVKKDYVQIATNILSDPKTARETDLRGWALDVLAKNSPVPFKPSLRDKIIAGKTLADFAWTYPSRSVKPPAKLMEAPKELLDFSPDNLQENAKRSKENLEQLKGLQEWVKDNAMKNGGWAGVALNLGLEEENKASRSSK